MLINDLDYLEVADSEQLNGGYTLQFASSTSTIAGTYQGEGTVNGGTYGSANANLGSSYSSPYGSYSYGPSVNAYTSGNIYAY